MGAAGVVPDHCVRSLLTRSPGRSPKVRPGLAACTLRSAARNAAARPRRVRVQGPVEHRPRSDRLRAGHLRGVAGSGRQDHGGHIRLGYRLCDGLGGLDVRLRPVASEGVRLRGRQLLTTRRSAGCRAAPGPRPWSPRRGRCCRRLRRPRGRCWLPVVLLPGRGWWSAAPGRRCVAARQRSRCC